MCVLRAAHLCYKESVVAINDLLALQVAIPLWYQGWEDLQGERRLLASDVEVHKDAHMTWLGWGDMDVQQLKLCTLHVLHEIQHETN